jgi:hypothetical protein
MLSIVRDIPPHVFGVRATGQVTADDLKSVLLPGLEVLTQKYNEIYYLLVLETPVEKFTAGAWFQDMIAGLKHFTKWKKVAVVTDEQTVEKFTDAFSYIAPGEFKGFKLEALEEAIAWLDIK